MCWDDLSSQTRNAKTLFDSIQIDCKNRELSDVLNFANSKSIQHVIDIISRLEWLRFCTVSEFLIYCDRFHMVGQKSVSIAKSMSRLTR
jgi:hypothetical protein